MKLPKKTENMIYTVIIAISVIAIVVLASEYAIKKNNTKTEATGTAVNLEGKKKEKVVVTVSTETIEDGLADMGFLITQEYYFTQVEKYTKEKKVLNFIPSSSEFMYSYDGAVMAGVDFQKIKISKDDDTQEITVELPPSEIHSVTIDKGTFKIYSEKDSLWNPLNLEDYNLSLVEYENAAKKKALENGILERSDEQAKKLVENFLENHPAVSGYKVSFAE